jgi:hypothetical protein
MNFDNWISALLEHPLGLDREADGYFVWAVENLKDMIAEQATVLALGAGSRSYRHATVAAVSVAWVLTGSQSGSD